MSDQRTQGEENKSLLLYPETLYDFWVCQLCFSIVILCVLFLLETISEKQNSQREQ